MKFNWKTFLLYALAVAVLAQIYISPATNSVFVLSAGVICLELMLLRPIKFPFFPFLLTAGGMAAVLRALLVALSGGAWLQACYATLIFYWIFALLVQLSHFRKIEINVLAQICILCVFDIVSNAAELAILGQISIKNIQMIVVTALLRGIIVWILDTCHRRQTLYILQEEHQKRYARLNQLAASIHAEAFYLSKSADNLNQLVKDSYAMYETATDPQISQAALTLSLQSHEIRKDCTRVISGLQLLTEEIEQEHALHLCDILRIMQDSTVRQREITDKNLTVTFDCIGDAEIKNYYDIFTILNNLISNSVDACGTDGEIAVRAVAAADAITFTVTDNGSGIEEDVLPFIFGAGFSTKFNHRTGEASSGIGLSHVKSVTDLLGGTIDVTSGDTTTFTVRIPTRQSEHRGN